MPEVKPEIETFAKIKVIGVGGGGGSAVNRMIQSGIKGVEFIVANTDIQALHSNPAEIKIHLGKDITKGLGAGMNPEVGKRAAEESQNELREVLSGAHLVFITCGLGGGTGTGAAPIVADIARDLGALTICVVTRPFDFEGAKRREVAERGYNELASRVDAIIAIPNERLFQIIDKKTSLLDAFVFADDILKQGVQSISEIITVPSLINVDFADVQTIMAGTGSALMGVGQASGENRATIAAKMAVESPLLDITIDGAKGILFTITGGKDLSLQEINEAAKVITERADSEAKIIFGATIDENLTDQIKITVIATNFESKMGKSKLSAGQVNEISLTRSYGAAPIKITEEKKPKTEQRNVEEFNKNNNSTNQIKKNEIIADQLTKITEQTPADNFFLDNINDSEDLDIPAFIRKKMG